MENIILTKFLLVDYNTTTFIENVENIIIFDFEFLFYRYYLRRFIDIIHGLFQSHISLNSFLKESVMSYIFELQINRKLNRNILYLLNG
jgi:hypothetical protein